MLGYVNGLEEMSEREREDVDGVKAMFYGGEEDKSGDLYLAKLCTGGISAERNAVCRPLE